jgi:oligoribonuclease NrnB/cAMP/cGMP phosphodiesterase (DHH superfamily)
MDIIFYHGHCPDGFVSAFVASKKYPEAKLIPLDHGAEFDFSQVEGKDVLMLDFSLRTRELNDKLNSLAKSFLILDHHKTAEATLKDAPYAVFDMKRSGAGLTWDYLFGDDRGPRLHDTHNAYTRPWLVSYTEDRDLWNWKLLWSKEVCAYLGTLEFTTEAWDGLYDMEAKDAAYKGEGALAHIQHYVREAVKQAQVGVLQGYQTAVVNALYLNCSEVGNELAKKYPVSLTWFERHDGMMQFSLRSEGDVDVSAIAKVFNGGGHLNAAGFQLKLEYGRIVLDRILGRHKEESGVTWTFSGCVK